MQTQVSYPNLPALDIVDCDLHDSHSLNPKSGNLHLLILLHGSLWLGQALKEKPRDPAATSD